MSDSTRWRILSTFALVLTLVVGSAKTGHAYQVSTPVSGSPIGCGASPMALSVVLPLIPQQDSTIDGQDEGAPPHPRLTVTFDEVEGSSIGEVDGVVSPALPTVRDANQNEKEATLASLNGYLACLDAGEYLRAFSYITQDQLRIIFSNWEHQYSPKQIAAALSAPPLALHDSWQMSFTMEELEITVLTDGSLFATDSTAGVILERSDSGYQIAESAIAYGGCPTCSRILDEEAAALQTPSPSTAFLSLMTTPTEENPTPVVVVDSDTGLFSRPEFNRDEFKLRPLAPGTRLFVEGSPVRNGGGTWIPVRLDDQVGFVDAWDVVSEIV